MRVLRWFTGNIGSLALAIVLAVTVWAVAVASDDPDEVRTLSVSFPVEVAHLDENLVVRGAVGQSATVTLRAPQSLWAQISAERLHVVADLTGLGAGEHRVPLHLETDLQPGAPGGDRPDGHRGGARAARQPDPHCSSAPDGDAGRRVCRQCAALDAAAGHGGRQRRAKWRASRP